MSGDIHVFAEKTINFMKWDFETSLALQKIKTPRCLREKSWLQDIKKRSNLRLFTASLFSQIVVAASKLELSAKRERGGRGRGRRKISFLFLVRLLPTPSRSALARLHFALAVSVEKIEGLWTVYSNLRLQDPWNSSIHSDLCSVTGGRNREWRGQAVGSLREVGEEICKVVGSGRNNIFFCNMEQ